MVEYAIKSGLCLIVLFSFYKLFMEGERFHKIKRVYLIVALLISLVLPLLTITYEVEAPIRSTENFVVASTDLPSNKSSENSFSSFWSTYIIVGIYLIGFLIFAYRFYRNLSALLAEARRNDKFQELNYIYVLLGRKLEPHSFLNYIFLNKTEFKKDRISEAVLEHEKAHVDQRHSLDLLLI